jgi:fatty acid-binding protein DegV
MKSGIILFEDGEVQQFGTISTARKMIASAQQIFEDLMKQERAQLLKTITEDELKNIVDIIGNNKKSTGDAN